MADDYVRRTAITRLSANGEQRQLLENTITEWKRGCQIATDLAWGKCNAKSGVQPLAYDSVREDTDLGSQHAILATKPRKPSPAVANAERTARRSASRRSPRRP